jgi:membrane protease YdiL (CAAX protease family)
MRLLLAALVLFVCYQLPHGVQSDYLMLAFPLVAWGCSLWLGFSNMQAWYIDARPGWGRLLALGLCLALLAKAVALYIGTRTGVYAFAWTGGPAAGALAAALGMALVSTFVPSIAEDIVTRGLVMRALPALAQRWTFVLLSATLFVLNHIYRLEKGPVEWLTLFAYGLAYAAALYRTRTLWAAVGLHWGWNLANSLADIFAQVDVADAVRAPFYSIAAHVVLLGCVLLLMRSAPRR